jgi:hypothetical protein
LTLPCAASLSDTWAPRFKAWIICFNRFEPGSTIERPFAAMIAVRPTDR